MNWLLVLLPSLACFALVYPIATRRFMRRRGEMLSKPAGPPGSVSAKRSASYWFTVMCREQAPVRAMFAGFMSMGIEMGIPQEVACELAYSLVSKPTTTIGEVRDEFMEEAQKWDRV